MPPPCHCFNITSTATPDPHFTQHPTNGKFYLTFTGGNRIPMWEAADLMSFWESQPKIGPVWHPPENTAHSDMLWAPELHCLRGRWYIYYAAAHPAAGNKSHRMYVLGGPKEHEDPHAGPWEFLGPIVGMDQRQWAIDGTVMELDGRLYFVYSGWPVPPERPWDDYNEATQLLFIIRLSTPTQADSDPVVISRPDQPWERMGHVGINEGPQYLTSPDGWTWRGIVYSCSASWTKEYKMATLRYVGGDPLNPASWLKSKVPLLQNDSSHREGPFGPGHGNFLHFKESGQTFALFHATDKDDDGFKGRKCRMQKVEWTPEGPHMGGCVGKATRDVDRFMGRKIDEESGGGGTFRKMLHGLQQRLG